MKKEFLGANSRFKTPPSDNLIKGAFAYELEASKYLYSGLSFADLAHVAALRKGDIITEDIYTALVSKLVAFHNINLHDLDFDPYVGDVYNNRDEILKQQIGDLAGYIHIGRARREASTISWQLCCRQKIATLITQVVNLIDSFESVCKSHKNTFMSDFTYLQHAQPTTLEHYLLTFVMPLTRDLERLQNALKFVNKSPAGSGSVNGSQLNIDREYLAELLGFDGLIEHTRDAMWAPDMVMDIMSPVISIMTTLDRLSEEFIIWGSKEFDYIDFSDQTSRTSVIMPQKKNPYGLAYIRGQARSLTGVFMSLINTNQTISGQPDNRIFAYYEIPRALDYVVTCVDLFNDVLTQSTFNKEQLAKAAGEGFTYSTDICDMLIVETSLDNRTVHKVVGLAVRQCIDTGKTELTLDDLYQAADKLNVSLPIIDETKFTDNMSPEKIVNNRLGIGSANPNAIKAMYGNINAATTKATAYVRTLNLDKFEQSFIAKLATK